MVQRLRVNLSVTAAEQSGWTHTWEKPNRGYDCGLNQLALFGCSKGRLLSYLVAPAKAHGFFLFVARTRNFKHVPAWDKQSNVKERVLSLYICDLYWGLLNHHTYKQPESSKWQQDVHSRYTAADIWYNYYSIVSRTTKQKQSWKQGTEITEAQDQPWKL